MYIQVVGERRMTTHTYIHTYIQVVGDREEPAAAEPQDYPEGYVLKPEVARIEEHYSESEQSDYEPQGGEQRQAVESEEEGAEEEWCVCMYVCMCVFVYKQVVEEWYVCICVYVCVCMCICI